MEKSYQILFLNARTFSGVLIAPVNDYHLIIEISYKNLTIRNQLCIEGNLFDPLILHFGEKIQIIYHIK